MGHYGKTSIFDLVSETILDPISPANHRRRDDLIRPSTFWHCHSLDLLAITLHLHTTTLTSVPIHLNHSNFFLRKKLMLPNISGDNLHNHLEVGAAEEDHATRG